MDRPEFLYHYTSQLHLPHILAAGELTTTESNVSLFRPHAGPDVVWALDTDWMPSTSDPHGLSGMKTQARIAFSTERLKKAVRWYDWDWFANMEDPWKAIMVETGGGDEAAKHWWVVPHPIISRHWLSVEALIDGEWKPVESARVAGAR